jgi:hypothetical protein
LPLSSDELSRWKCLRPEKTDRIKALWGGDTSAYDSDDSRADAALCSFLLILTNGDRARAESVFSQSALGQRGKWKDRQDYRDRTFTKALDGFEPWQDAEPAPEPPASVGSVGSKTATGLCPRSAPSL